jgi:hypothetical protein
MTFEEMQITVCQNAESGMPESDMGKSDPKCIGIQQPISRLNLKLAFNV